MNFEFILYVLIFIAIIFIIFKVIKKVIFAIITVIGLFLLVIVGVGALVYADYNYLTSQETFVVELVYQKNDSFVLGVEIPIVDSELVLENVSSISDLESVDRNIDSKAGKFLVIVDDVLFQKLASQQTISLDSFVEGSSTQDVDLNLPGSEISMILETQNFEEELSTLIIEENNIPLAFQDTAQEIIIDALDNVDESVQVTPQEAIFLLIISNSIENERNMLTIIEGFKKETLEIYPNRFVFRLIKLFPAETINGFISED